MKLRVAGGQVILSMLKYDLFVRIDIEDEGIGIDEDEQHLIFQRFYRGEAVRGAEGRGIGLYLARKIVARQGGYMKVTSARGKGSCFSIFLPIEPASGANFASGAE
ncbi:ATP-binding protein [Paenibacillus pinisoli]|uniref:histidine kinase n=1 Tax=Paenibacillus pinisoli TaxID=1276110 RepID=A0A3A6PHU7_9BACL|nr:ATP-binding protein [Paenibacillus pinisoli]RJX37779.1 ATP-binding protein [Paenibacillus pinisoli]